jgi:hypothetical protein
VVGCWGGVGFPQVFRCGWRRVDDGVLVSVAGYGMALDGFGKWFVSSFANVQMSWKLGGVDFPEQKLIKLWNECSFTSNLWHGLSRVTTSLEVQRRWARYFPRLPSLSPSTLYLHRSFCPLAPYAKPSLPKAGLPRHTSLSM